MLGYFVHLLSDNLWSKHIAVTCKRIYAPLFAERGKMAAWAVLKQDWYALDQLYVRDHPTCLFWRVFMRAPNPPSYLPFIPTAALCQQLAHIRQYYSAPDASWVLERSYPYLNATTMDRYVSNASSAVHKILVALQARPAPEDALSALVLLDDAGLRPYDPPLGDAT
jgi:hypothetical protein